jgi:aminopeptidase N
MHHWTASVGYPVVKISSKPNGKILLEQSRFLLTDGNPDSTIWNISVTFRTPEVKE